VTNSNAIRNLRTSRNKGIRSRKKCGEKERKKEGKNEKEAYFAKVISDSASLRKRN